MSALPNPLSSMDWEPFRRTLPQPRDRFQNRVCRRQRRSRLPVPVGFMNSNTTASAFWRGGTVQAFDCLHAPETISHLAFPLSQLAVSKLPVRSCLIDGEAIVCDENGVAVFELIRRHDAGERAVLSAFDLLELDGKDLRRKPIEKRKELLAELLNGSQVSIVFNECFGEDGEIVFREACKLGCEGIVSKRLGSIYRRGLSPLWLKVKNPNAPAVKREAEEDWGQ